MSKPTYVLRLERKNQPSTELRFDKPRIALGREAGDIVLGDPGTSGKHAEIVFADGLVRFRDLGSTNGSWIGSRRVTEEVLKPGTALMLGGCTLTLVRVEGLEPVGTLVMAPPRAPNVGTEVQTRAAVAAAGPALPATPSAAPAPATARAPMDRQRLVLVGAVGALLLAVVVFATRCGGGGGGGAAPGKKLTATHEATVKAVWFRGPVGPQASGGTSPSTVRIAPNSKDGASVGVLEEYAGGAGNQWRTATWLAAFSASQLTGTNLTDHEFLVRTGGHIDGPSAGMLMTATMIAILRGKTPRPDTTMTGTINPDGSAGPVGGIVQKMEGASKDGIKRFGFPMGARNHQDLRTGRSVDLFDAGREFGLEVREIHDVFEAYEFLTDDTLARTAPAAESDMELDSETSARLRTKNEKWTARLQSDIANLGSLTRDLGELAPRLQPLADLANAAYKRAQDFERSDFLTSAFESHVQAAVFAGMTREATRFLKAYSQNDMRDVVAQIQAAATVKGQLSAMLGEAELQSKRKTVGGQINTLRAYQAAVIANSFTAMADNAADTAQKLLDLQKEGKLKPEQEQALPEVLFHSITYYSIAKTMLDVAEDQKDFGGEEGTTNPIPGATIGRVAQAYGSAAGAVLQYLESLTLDDAAREAGIDKATAQNRLAANDTDYLVASNAVRIAEGLGSKSETHMLRLAAGSMAFLKGASLVNKYYSLGGQRDQAGDLVLTNRKALSAQLDLGRQLAREAAATAKRALGFVPVAARMAYQLGVAKREGDDEEKLQALESFWESAFWSRLAAHSAAAQ
ncbi:MAG: FHA domain-containing protein [Planctomycetes bacterium]|nr:FHA domain-containing protein [Planctomycetota bacterium]